MVLQHGAGSEDGPGDVVEDPAAAMRSDPKKELAALKATRGGIALASKLISGWLQRMMNLYYVGTKSLWTWYNDQVTTVKNGKNGMLHYIKNSCGGCRRQGCIG